MAFRPPPRILRRRATPTRSDQLAKPTQEAAVGSPRSGAVAATREAHRLGRPHTRCPPVLMDELTKVVAATPLTARID